MILTGMTYLLVAIPWSLAKLNVDRGTYLLGSEAGLADGLFVYGRLGAILICLLLAFLRYCMTGKHAGPSWLCPSEFARLQRTAACG